MCGIAGFIDPRCAAAEREPALRAMLDRIAHRGPDDSGTLLDGAVAVGHRRLAVIDLSEHGHQPMESRSGRFVITYNGEIYNYQRLRAELEAKGHVFVGHSDTAVLLALIEEAGLESALRRCIGMFALAVWDRRQRTLQLARDRFGEKPLYYALQGGVFLFGSELKALASHPAFSRRVDPASLEELLRFGYTSAPHSIYQQTWKLLPGHILAVRPQGGDTAPAGDHGYELESKPYWSHQEVLLAGMQRPFAGTFEDATGALEELLSDAVRLQAQTADVPLGAFLSGGVDSSTVVALMQRSSRHPVQTYSIGFAEDGFNEAGYAKAVAGHLGTRHSELYVSSTDALQVVPKLPVMYDEPLADSSQIPTFLVAQLARTEVTVALSGDGGDELFAGYPRYAFGSSIAGIRGRQLLGFTLQSALRAHLDLLARVLPTSLRGRLARRRLETLSRLLAASSYRQIAESIVELNRDSASLVQTVVRRDSAFSSRRPLVLERAYGQMAMLLDRETYLPDDVLHKVDRATMAVSLESRAPLLDHRIAEFAATLPMSFLMRNGENKRVLRAVLYRLVPQGLVDRPKTGFGIPLGRWLRGELREWAWELLASRKLGDLLDMDRCRQVFERHLSGDRDLSLACWGVLSALAWAQAWL